MRILVVHNYYGSSAPSGENIVFEAERELLREHGHEVQTFTRHSDAIRARGLWGKVVGAFSTVANPFAARALARQCRAFRPDVVHFHNTFPLISLWAVRTASKFAPVVMTLHNYRLFCASGMLARDGAVCTLCLRGRSVFAGLRYRCYRKSLLATLPLFLSAVFYRRPIAKWVSRFIVFSVFQKRMMGCAGLPLEKMGIKPNFIVSDTPPRGDSFYGNVILYVGRLSEEKGIGTLISAWRLVLAECRRVGLSTQERPKLCVIGDGDRRPLYEQLAAGLSVEFCGRKDNADVRKSLSMARACVLPSECYEGMPMTILEALAAATPCVVSDLGTLPDLVEDGRTGFVFKAGDASALAAALLRMVRLNELDYRRMRRAAREDYERRFSPGRNYTQLMTIYREVVK